MHPPGFFPDWHVGVRVSASGKLVGFITGVPATVHMGPTRMQMAEIYFLCVHKKLRSKRLAPVLIKVDPAPCPSMTVGMPFHDHWALRLRRSPIRYSGRRWRSRHPWLCSGQAHNV